jgi:hypothetical protein
MPPKTRKLWRCPSAVEDKVVTVSGDSSPVGSENLIRPQIVDLQRLAAELSPPVSRALARVRRRVSNNSPGTVARTPAQEFRKANRALIAQNVLETRARSSFHKPLPFNEDRVFQQHSYYRLGKLGGVLKVTRKTHAQKDAAQAAEFQRTLCERLANLDMAGAKRVRLWVSATCFQLAR